MEKNDPPEHPQGKYGSESIRTIKKEWKRKQISSAGIGFALC